MSTTVLRSLNHLYKKINKLQASNICKKQYIRNIGYLMMKYKNENEFDWFSKLEINSTILPNNLDIKLLHYNNDFTCNLWSLPPNYELFDMNDHNSALIILGGELEKTYFNGDLKYKNKIENGNLFYIFENELFSIKNKNQQTIILEIFSNCNSLDDIADKQIKV